ncbi:MAG: hypothetical protein IKD78_10210 [Bacteroidales bacterium]|nr:hypothetical protein [Bacteroidales bacterium]
MGVLLRQKWQKTLKSGGKQGKSCRNPQGSCGKIEITEKFLLYSRKQWNMNTSKLFRKASVKGNLLLILTCINIQEEILPLSRECGVFLWVRRLIDISIKPTPDLIHPQKC